MTSRDSAKRKGGSAKESESKSQKPMEPLPIVRALFLVFIRRHPNSSGYDLMRLISDSTKGLVELKSGTVYSELRRLEGMGLVKSTREESGRKRRSYVITAQGIKSLKLIAQQMRMRVNYIIEPLLGLIDESE